MEIVVVEAEKKPDCRYSMRFAVGNE